MTPFLIMAAVVLKGAGFFSLYYYAKAFRLLVQKRTPVRFRQIPSIWAVSAVLAVFLAALFLGCGLRVRNNLRYRKR